MSDLDLASIRQAAEAVTDGWDDVEEQMRHSPSNADLTDIEAAYIAVAAPYIAIAICDHITELEAKVAMALRFLREWQDDPIAAQPIDKTGTLLAALAGGDKEGEDG